MSETLLVVVVSGGVWWWCLVSWHFSSPVIGRHKKCCLVIGYNVSNIVTNQICMHGRFQYTRKAFNWHITEIVGLELKQLTKHLDRWGSSLAPPSEVIDMVNPLRTHLQMCSLNSDERRLKTCHADL